MASGSRSRRSPRRGGGKFGGFVFALLLVAALVAFYQIPVKPTVHGFIATLQARSEQINIWVHDFTHDVLNFNFDPQVPAVPGGGSTDAPTDKASGTTASPVVTVDDSNKAKAELSKLKVASAQKVAYNRTEWKQWDNVRSCWTVREEAIYRGAVKDSTLVLQDKNKKVTTDVNNACYIVSGTWIDPYTGDTITNPSSLDIDHLIPLGYVAAHGGQAWDKGKKESYANNLTENDHLIAVSASANRSKGDSGPADWKPTNKAFWCQYSVTWVNVSTTWNISVTSADKSALTDMLNTCPTK